RFKTLPHPVFHYRRRKSTCLRFVTQGPKSFRQFAFSRRIHEISRRQALPRVHSHVQRPVLLKTKASVRPIELRRTHPEIKQHAVTTSWFKPIRQICKIPLSQLQPALKRSEPRLRHLNCGA